MGFRLNEKAHIYGLVSHFKNLNFYLLFNSLLRFHHVDTTGADYYWATKKTQFFWWDTRPYIRDFSFILLKKSRLFFLRVWNSGKWRTIRSQLEKVSRVSGKWLLAHFTTCKKVIFLMTVNEIIHFLLK